MESSQHLPENPFNDILTTALQRFNVPQPPPPAVRTTSSVDQQTQTDILPNRFEIICVNNEASFQRCGPDSTPPPVYFEIGTHPTLLHSASLALHNMLHKTTSQWIEFLMAEISVNGGNNITAITICLARLGIIFSSKSNLYNTVEGKEMVILQERTGLFVIHIGIFVRILQYPNDHLQRLHFYIFFNGEELHFWNGKAIVKYTVLEADRKTKKAARAVFYSFKYHPGKIPMKVNVNNIFRVSQSLE